jgi:hypothetical protein
MTKMKYFKEIFKRSFQGTFRLLEIGEAIVALLVHVIGYFAHEYKETLEVLFVVLVALLVLTFFTGLLVASYVFHKESDERNTQSIQELNRTLKETQDKAGVELQKAKVEFESVMKASSERYEKELTELRSQLTDKKKRTEIQNQLGVFIHEGQQLMAQCCNEFEPIPSSAANEWGQRMERYLEINLGASYVYRSRSDAGLPMVGCTILSREHVNLWKGIRIRIANLAKFLEEMASKS